MTYEMQQPTDAAPPALSSPQSPQSGPVVFIDGKPITDVISGLHTKSSLPGTIYRQHVTALTTLEKVYPATADWLWRICKEVPSLVKWTWATDTAIGATPQELLQAYRKLLQVLVALRCGEDANLETIAKRLRMPPPTASAAWALQKLGVELSETQWLECIYLLRQTTHQ